MKTMTVGEFKAHFSEALKNVEAGEKIAITYGKKKEIKAMLVPTEKPKLKKRKLGIMAGKASFEFVGDFKMTEEELINL